MLLTEISEHTDVGGLYVPASDLQRLYEELALERGWQRKSWYVIGRELGQLTERRMKRRGAQRFTVYKIPRA